MDLMGFSGTTEVVPFYKVQTGQILYGTARGDGLQVLVRSRRHVEGKHALDSERSDGEAEGIFGGLCVRGLDDERALPHARDFSAHRLGGASPLRRGWRRGSGGAQPRPLAASQPDLGRDRTAGSGASAGASAVGSA